jgi:predicted phage terminase large subunit-like protein
VYVTQNSIKLYAINGLTGVTKWEVAPAFGVLFDMVGEPNARFLYESNSLRVAPDVLQRVWGVAQNGDLYRLDGWRGQTASDEWIERQIDLVVRHKPFAGFGEAGVIQKAIQPMLKRRMLERGAHCRMEWLPSISDKPTRARGFQARAAMGAVYFEPGADVEEFIRFPAGKNDDDVDTASLIGRALDEAHPAIAQSEPDKRKKVDRWAKAFGDHEDTESWKTA